jgi:spermidine synthase
MRKQLLVNGAGMSALTPVTKMMSHLPLAFRDAPPSNALVICFGMGTSFRSLLSWGIDSTAVELIPSVPALFSFFHADAGRILASPRAHVVVDDGRRFLERTDERFDVITIDPPPPVEAAGSSLLYSQEFYALARKRLKPGGIVQQWLPGGDAVVIGSFTRAIASSFPHLRAFRSVEGWGFHFLASESPLPARTATELSARLSAEAARDLVEWGPFPDPAAQFDAVLRREVAVASLLAAAPQVGPLTDDRPYNEYYWLRRLRARGR